MATFWKVPFRPDEGDPFFGQVLPRLGQRAFRGQFIPRPEQVLHILRRQMDVPAGRLGGDHEALDGDRRRTDRRRNTPGLFF